jgi:hypothetical protein
MPRVTDPPPAPAGSKRAGATHERYIPDTPDTTYTGYELLSNSAKGTVTIAMSKTSAPPPQQCLTSPNAQPLLSLSPDTHSTWPPLPAPSAPPTLYPSDWAGVCSASSAHRVSLRGPPLVSVHPALLAATRTCLEAPAARPAHLAVAASLRRTHRTIVREARTAPRRAPQRACSALPTPMAASQRGPLRAPPAPSSQWPPRAAPHATCHPSHSRLCSDSLRCAAACPHRHKYAPAASAVLGSSFQK